MNGLINTIGSRFYQVTLSAAKRLLRKSKESERDLGKWLLEHDGPDDGVLGKMASSAGRVGHLKTLQFDTVSRSYAGENKRVRLNKTQMTWWLQILSIAAKYGKHALLSIEPSNEVKPKVPRMHVITAERHAELLAYEKVCATCAECSTRRSLL